MIVNTVGFETLVRREIVRTFAIINQVIWPPVIQTLLYVFVFGLALGSRIQNVQGVSYAQFLIPGLIMLQVDALAPEASMERRTFLTSTLTASALAATAPRSYLQGAQETAEGKGRGGPSGAKHAAGPPPA